MGFTFSQASSLLRDLVGSGSSTSDTAYLALSSTAPTIEGENVTEPSGNNYERALIKGFFGTPAISEDGTTTEIVNNKEVHFNEATGAWGTLTHFAIYASATATTPQYVGALVNSITPTVNTVPLIRVGDLKISLV